MGDRKSFILYLEYKQYLNELSDEECGKLFKAVFEYVENQKITQFEGMLKIIFMLIRSQFDRDFEKYDTIIEKRREAGKLGGRPKKNGRRKSKKSKWFFRKANESKKS